MTQGQQTVLRPERRWSSSFVLAVPFGLLLLWATAFLGVFLPVFGDCFGPEDECRAAWEAGKVHQDVLLGIVAGLTFLGVLAVAFGRRLWPALLLAGTAAAAVLVVSPAMLGSQIGWWVPPALGLTSPALLILALAAAGQVRWWTQAERSRHASPNAQNAPLA